MHHLGRHLRLPRRCKDLPQVLPQWVDFAVARGTDNPLHKTFAGTAPGKTTATPPATCFRVSLSWEGRRSILCRSRAMGVIKNSPSSPYTSKTTAPGMAVMGSTGCTSAVSRITVTGQMMTPSGTLTVSSTLGRLALSLLHDHDPGRLQQSARSAQFMTFRRVMTCS